MRVEARLTGRERDILELVAVGMTTREIAGALHLSQGTVKKHLSSIFSKLGVTNRTEAAIAAFYSIPRGE